MKSFNFLAPKLSSVDKLQLSAPSTFLTHDVADTTDLRRVR